MNIHGILGFDNPVVPDLRNGVAGTLLAPARRGAIPVEYYWRTVEGLAGRMDLAPIYARLAYGAILGDEVNAAALAADGAAAAVRGAAADPRAVDEWEVFIPPVQRLRAARVQAIILGGVRAGVATSYSIAAGDLHATEVYAGGGVTVDANVGTWTHTRNPNAGALVAEEALRELFGGLEPVEETLFIGMMKLGMGIAPLVGSSLIDTGHHYLSQMSKPFDGVERQVLAGLSVEAREMFMSAGDIARGLAYHKACHPIRNSVLISFARDLELPKRLSAINLGSAALRLPYQEPEVKSAKAYLAIVEAVRAFGDVSRCRVRLPGLEAALKIVEETPAGLQAVAPPPIAQAAGAAPPVIQAVDARAEAIRTILKPALDKARAGVGVAVGIYVVLVEEGGLAATADTRLLAYSIQKIRKERTSDIAQGTYAVRAHKTMIRAMAENGAAMYWTVTDAEAAEGAAAGGGAGERK